MKPASLIRRTYFYLKRDKIIKDYLNNFNFRKLHFGCGPHIFKDGWLNSDYRTFHINETHNNYIILNACKPLPLPNHSFDCIYHAHMFEHINLKDGEHFLKECFRILKKKGIMRISTPDLEFFISRYLKGDNKLIFAKDINDVFYNCDHRFIYDFETLKYLLLQIGFTHVERKKIYESNHSCFSAIGKRENRDKWHEEQSLILEATK